MSASRGSSGVCVDIPLGTAFQYRCTGSVPFVFTCTGMPPSPGDDEAGRELALPCKNVQFLRPTCIDSP